jgi:hypothetical protein
LTLICRDFENLLSNAVDAVVVASVAADARGTGIAQDDERVRIDGGLEITRPHHADGNTARATAAIPAETTFAP